MMNFLVLLVVALILSLAGYYIYREKKQGKACIGCPYSGTCAKRKQGGCSENP